MVFPTLVPKVRSWESPAAALWVCRSHSLNTTVEESEQSGHVMSLRLQTTSVTALAKSHTQRADTENPPCGSHKAAVANITKGHFQITHRSRTGLPLFRLTPVTHKLMLKSLQNKQSERGGTAPGSPRDLLPANLQHFIWPHGAPSLAQAPWWHPCHLVVNGSCRYISMTEIKFCSLVLQLLFLQVHRLNLYNGTISWILQTAGPQPHR